MSIHGHPATVCLLFRTTNRGSIALSPKFPPGNGGLQIVGKGGHVVDEGLTGIVEGGNIVTVD